MYTEFTVLIDSSTAKTKQQKVTKAQRVFQDVDDLAFWYTTTAPTDSQNTVVELRSPAGEEVVKNRIEQTTQEKATKLETVLNEINSTTSLKKAVQSRTLVTAAKAIGAWNDPTGYLIDGTSYSKGRPILSHTDVKKICKTDTTGDEFVLVDLKAKY